MSQVITSAYLLSIIIAFNKVKHTVGSTVTSVNASTRQTKLMYLELQHEMRNVEPCCHIPNDFFMLVLY